MYKELLTMNNFENILARIEVSDKYIFFKEYFMYTKKTLSEKSEFSADEREIRWDNYFPLKKGNYVFYANKDSYKVYPISSDCTLEEYLIDHDSLDKEMIFVYSDKKNMGAFIDEIKDFLNIHDLYIAHISVIVFEKGINFDYACKGKSGAFKREIESETDFETSIKDFSKGVQRIWKNCGSNNACGKYIFTINRKNLVNHKYESLSSCGLDIERIIEKG